MNRTKRIVQSIRSRNLGANMRKDDLPDNQTSSMVLVINNSSVFAAPAFITWTLFATFAAITAASTTDLQLLWDGPIAVPLLPDAKLPHSYYYAAVGWFLLALHLHLLLHVDNIARKVRLLATLPTRAKAPDPAKEITSLPIINWLARRDVEKSFAGFIQAFVAWLSIVAAPLAVQLLHQAAFLPYQSEAITWNQRVALLIHVGVIIYYWRRITASDANESSSERRDYAGIKAILLVWIPAGLSVALSLFIFTIPDERLELSLEAIGLERRTGHELVAAFQDKADPRQPARDTRPQLCGFVSVFGKIPIAEVLVPEGLKTNCITAAIFHTGGPFRRTISVIEKPAPLSASEDTRARPGIAEQGLPLPGFARSFRYAHLPAFDLRNADLRLAKLTHANLEGANLNGALMHGIDATFARIIDADLRNALLFGADLSDANLKGSDLRGARLAIGSIFSSAEPLKAWVGGQVFRNAQLNRAILTQTDWRGVNLSYVKCQECWLNSANMAGVVAISADLTGSRLGGANLDGSVLVDVKLPGSNLSGASLIGANLDNTNLSAAVLIQADFSGATMQNIDLTLADLTSANLSSVDLSPSAEKDVLFGSSTMKGANLSGANLRGTNVERVDMSLVLSDKVTKVGRHDPKFSDIRDAWSESELLSQRDAAVRLAKLKSRSTEGLIPTNCIGSLSSCPVTPQAQSAAAAAYAAFLRDSICTSEDAHINEAAAGRFVDSLFGGEARVLAPAESMYPETKNGTDWPGFKSALLSEVERINQADCVQRVPPSLRDRIVAGDVFLKSAGQKRLPESGYRLKNARFSYPIELTRRYSPTQ